MAWADSRRRFNPARVCVCEKEQACESDHAFISHAVAYSVWQLERTGAAGRSTGIKKALSPWDASANEQHSLGGLPC